jgi:pentalenolactone synthase
MAPVQLPFKQTNPVEVAPVLQELRTIGNVHAVRTAMGDPAWLVIGHPEIRQLLDDDRLGRSHPTPETAARSSESVFLGGPMGEYATERTDHARFRALLQPHFTPKHMRTLRTRVEGLTVELLDAMVEHGPPTDLQTALALPLPVLVICELLGVPYEDREDFHRWSTEVASIHDRALSEGGLAQLYSYGLQLVARKRFEPGDDVISRLCATDGVGDDEIAMLGMGLLFAGHETTVGQIGLGTLLLLADPQRWRALVDDPSKIPSAVEETLRASRAGGGAIPRYAHQDLDIDGVAIKTGELVLLDIGAGNFDPVAFPDPTQFDIDRRSANHLLFGYGARYCLGAPLARIELQTVFEQLVSRFPTLELAVDVDEVAIRPDVFTGGVVELPVKW